MYLINDVVSIKGFTYGFKGEQVTIIGDHDNIVTVKSETGNLFSTLKSNLSTIKIQKDAIKFDRKDRKVSR